ncbi:bifunctional phosphoglucose/phosphomannose isomerase [Candidatus Wolfebacteria bacterium]|nr:MAG: bifunctional phosphoglucose/phosphomannose isomerase [Candidatus Wolfebacteria bacterium]
MQDALKKFADQFLWKPEIIYADALKSLQSFVVAGMGGSHLAADLLTIYNPEIDLYIHKDYGLPPLSEERLKETLLIASSYSGNTEEVIDFARSAIEKKLQLVIITTGGMLLEIAQSNSIPYIQIPDTGIQPRNALGYSLIALASAIGDAALMDQLSSLATRLTPEKLEEQGKELATSLFNKIPIIYSSTQNAPIAYNWKIKFNETGKIPAFYNVFPELNHNEMAGFDTVPSIKELVEKFHFIFLKDASDHSRISTRMEISQALFESRGLPVHVVELQGDSVLVKIFNSLLLADWITYHTALKYGAEPEKVKIIEEFKQKIK